MKTTKLFFAAVLLATANCLLPTFSSAQATNWQWAKSAGGNMNDWATSITADASGNVFAASSFYSPSIVFGSSTTLTNANTGTTDMFLVKYDANGTVLWAKSAGGSYDDRANSVTTDAAGNVFVAGSFSSPSIVFGSIALTNADNTGNTSDMFLVKYNSAGSILWAKSAGGIGDDEAISVAVDTSSGNVFTAGSFYSASIAFGSTALTNTGAADMFLVKYDVAGSILWAKSEGGSSTDYAYSVTTDTTGNVFAAGTFYSSTIVFGATTLTNADNSVTTTDMFLVKYDGATGSILWAKSAGGSSQDATVSIAADASGNVSAAGYFISSTVVFGSITLANANTGYPDMFLVKYNSAGTILWAEKAGGSSNDAAKSVTTDASGNIYVAGYFQSLAIVFGSITLNNYGAVDMFLVKYNSAGTTLWAKSAGGSYNDDYAYSVTADASGNVFVTGYFDTPVIVFGSTTLTNANNTGITSDIFIAKLGTLTSIESPPQANQNDIAVYPNPSAGKFTIAISQHEFVSGSHVFIYNVLGEKVYSTSNIKPLTSNEIDLRSQPNGIYFLTIETEKESFSQKIVIQK